MTKYILLILWIICIFVSTNIGLRKGEGIVGFLAGLLLGPLGILLMFISSGTTKNPDNVSTQYGIGGALVIEIGGIIIVILCIQFPMVGIPLAIISVYKYIQEKEARINYEEVRRTYEKDGEGQSERAESNNNDKSQTGSYQENGQRNKESESDTKQRIFQCPSCNQKIRVRLPIPKSVGRCTNCKKLFRVSSDEAENLYVYSVNNSQSDNYDQELVLDDCFTILQVDKAATSKVIKAAYRKRMLEYHPDRVSKLGEELRKLAERKAKQINAAYGLLKKSGHIE